jgi:hypothetical protein
MPGAAPAVGPFDRRIARVGSTCSSATHPVREVVFGAGNRPNWGLAQQTINFITLNSFLSFSQSRKSHISDGFADAKH